MTPTDISSALAAEHTRDLLRAGATSRLAALARCCRTTLRQHATAMLRRARPATAPAC
ncbi:MAG TPA: hypothetical protein VF053_08630 [Streptosporangiales bacterium]